jgi:hypothetical protein
MIPAKLLYIIAVVLCVRVFPIPAQVDTLPPPIKYLRLVLMQDSN